MAYLTQESFAGGEVSPLLYGRTQLAKYGTALAGALNCMVNVEGPLTNRTGPRYIGAGIAGRLVDFQFTTNDAYALLFGDQVMRVFRNGVVVLYPSGHPNEGQVVQIASPYPAAVLPTLHWEQQLDTLYLQAAGYAPKLLTRTDHHEWSFTDQTFAPTIAAPTNVVATEDPGDYRYVVTSFKRDPAEESLASSEATTSRNATSANPVTLTWTAEPAAEQYNIYKFKNGVFAFTGVADSTSFVDDGISPDTSDTPPEARNPFDTDYPTVAAIHEQRLYYGRLDQIFGSVIGSPSNMSVSTVVKATDAVTFTIAGERLSQVRELVSFGSLLAFTTDSLVVIGGDDAKPIAPDEPPRIKVQQGAAGFAEIRPIIVNDTVLAVARDKRRIYAVNFNLGSNAFKSSQVNRLAMHLFAGAGGRIVEWAYFPAESDWVFVVKADGAVACICYQPDQEVFGITPLVFDGSVRSVVTLYEGDNPKLYMLIEREGVWSVQLYEHKCDCPRPVYLDAYLSYDGAPVSSVSGLEHLANRTVGIVADGEYVGTAPVTLGGTVALPFPASAVDVGIPYESVVETLRAGADQIAGKPLQIGRLVVRTDNTKGIEVGAGGGEFVPLYIPMPDGPHDTLALDTQAYTAGPISMSGRVTVRQRRPFNMTLLALYADTKGGAR